MGFLSDFGHGIGSAFTAVGRAFATGASAGWTALRSAPTPASSFGAGTKLPRADWAYDADHQGQTKPNVQIINDWVVPSTLGWTLDALQAAILGLENGNLYAAHSLMLAMTRDATIGHGLMVRRMSLSALKWSIAFPACVPEGARRALLANFAEALTPQDLATAQGYTVMLGLAPATQQWYRKTEPDGETYWQWRTEILETGHLQFRADVRRYFFVARQGYLDVIDDGNAWALFKSLGDRRHHLDCAVRALATLWFIVQEAVRYHRAYNAEYGRPIKGLMVPDSHRLSEDVAQLVQQASGLYGGSVIILPQFAEGSGQASFDMKLIEAKSRGFQTFTELARTARDLITLYLVGVLETTGGSSASDAKAKTQLRVADRYTTADARVREDAVNRILRKWAEFNGYAEAPVYSIDTEPPADEAARAAVAKDRAAAIKSTADALKAMAESGVRVDEERAATLFREVGVSLREAPRGEPLDVSVVASLAALERVRNSVLVCWELPPLVAQALRVPGGEDPADMHLTLAVCPGASVPEVIAALVAVAPRLEAVAGFVTGNATWPAAKRVAADAKTTDGSVSVEPSDPQLAFASLVDAPGLSEMRAEIVRALSVCDVEVAASHGFVPHVTRAYLPAGSSVEAPGEPVAITIDRVSVWTLNGRVRIPLRIGSALSEAADGADDLAGGSAGVGGTSSASTSSVPPTRTGTPINAAGQIGAAS
jgi:hypothetical protein